MTQQNQEFATPQEALAHFGVKGMKWGVRKSESGGGRPRGKIRRGLTKANVATDAGHKVIEEGEKKLIFLPLDKRQKAASATQTRVLGTARKINKQPQFKGKDIKKNPALKKAYFDKVEAEAKKIYAEELGIARTEAWGEFLGVDTRLQTSSMRFSAARDRLKHADDAQVTLLELNFTFNELGQIEDVSVPEKYLAHNDEDVICHGEQMAIDILDTLAERTGDRS